MRTAGTVRRGSSGTRSTLKVWLDLVDGEPEKLTQLAVRVPPSISESCIHAVKELFRNDSHTLIRMLDAWGKPGAGMLNGNTMWLGSYDECAPLNDSDFCLLKLLLGNDEGIWSGVFTEEAAIISVAMCVPVQCDAEDVKKAVDAIILSQLDNSDQTGVPMWMTVESIGGPTCCTLTTSTRHSTTTVLPVRGTSLWICSSMPSARSF